MLKIDVKYDTTEVEVNDLVKVSVNLAFNPLPELDISDYSSLSLVKPPGVLYGPL